jgi:hypothetical protein
VDSERAVKLPKRDSIATFLRDERLVSANTGLLLRSASEQSDRADKTGGAGLGVDGCELLVSSHVEGCWSDDFCDIGAVDVRSETPCQLRYAIFAAARAGNVLRPRRSAVP